MCVNKLGNATLLILYQEPVYYTMSSTKYLITISLKNLGPLKILNDSLWILNQFGIIQNLQRSPVPKTSKWSGTLLGTRYGTPTLVVTYSEDLQS